MVFFDFLSLIIITCQIPADGDLSLQGGFEGIGIRDYRPRDPHYGISKIVRG
ncbi:MAG TPA: hypothetical protein PKM50_08175 [Methanoregula sp.]|nr:hypothetical protein [Methanoregula sp.]